MSDAIEPLAVIHRRILGVLVEKQKTSKTADAYPLTLNSLLLGCNQKSAREPVMDLSEDEVEESLPALQAAGMVSKITGSRVDRWKHLLYERLNVNAAEMAVLAELMLRGPQSVGDLRSRADRMSPIAGLDELQAILKPLSERKLVVFLTDPDRRGAMVTHGFHTSDELATFKAGSFPEPAPARTAPSSSLAQDVEMLKEAVRQLQQEVRELKQK